MKLFWRLGHRWNEALHRRAIRRGNPEGAAVFKARSEKFCRRIKGAQRASFGGFWNE